MANFCPDLDALPRLHVRAESDCQGREALDNIPAEHPASRSPRDARGSTAITSWLLCTFPWLEWRQSVNSKKAAFVMQPGWTRSSGQDSSAAL